MTECGDLTSRSRLLAMGNRANFVVIENKQWRLHYDHWAGCRMLDALIGGPGLALRYVERLRRCDDEWLDEVWADGAALIDLDHRRLLFFGDELMTTMAERRAMFAVLAVLWAGYEVSWAYRGMSEIAEYVGYDLERPPRSAGQPPKLASGREGLCHLVSVVGVDGAVRLWPLWWGRSAVWAGPEILNLLPGRGRRTLGRDIIPESGVHIDLQDKLVGMWTTSEAADTRVGLSDLWTGWTLETWDDRYENQVSRCRGGLRVPDLDVAQGVTSARDWLRERIFQSFEDSPLGQMDKLIGILSDVAPGLAVGPDAIADRPGRPSSAEWAAFERACTDVAERAAAR